MQRDREAMMIPGLKKLSEQSMVITGATSEIGLATARLAARRGARVLASSSNARELRELVDELRALGASAACVIADLSEPEQVQRIAHAAVTEFGGVDTWVNCAGEADYGRLVDSPLAEQRRLFDVNFWSVVYGCRAVLPLISHRGGVIVNLAGVPSGRAIRAQGIRGAARQAIQGYTETLRAELARDRLPVSVTLVHAAPPITNARIEAVARLILHCAAHPRRNLYVSDGAWLLQMIEELAPMTWLAGLAAVATLGGFAFAIGGAGRVGPRALERRRRDAVA